MSFNALFNTFLMVLRRHVQKHLNAGEPSALPSQVSVGWYCQMKKRLGVDNAATQSNERKRVTPEDGRSFLDSCKKKRAMHNIPANMIVAFDETNCFMHKPSRRVQTAPSERRAKTGRRVKHRVNSRATYTVAVTFSPCAKGKVLIMAARCTTKMRKNIERDFGKHIHLITGAGKSVNGTVHARRVLPEIIGPFARSIRHDSKYSNERKCLYLEDIASVHTGGRCTQTSDVGLQQVRKDFFTAASMERECLPSNGTPDFAPPEQMFKVAKLAQQTLCEEVVGVGDDLARRPRDEVTSRLGGPFLTDANNRRGATLYHAAGSWARAWADFPQVATQRNFIGKASRRNL